jgi:bifunctional DNase/RNase
VWVDARPSDGIALALARGAPLFVGPRVAASEPGPGDPSAEETPAAQPVAQRLRVP